MGQPAARPHGTPGRSTQPASSPDPARVPSQGARAAEGTSEVPEVPPEAEAQAAAAPEVLLLLQDPAQRTRVATALTSSRYTVARPERLLDWVRARRPHVLLVTDDGERAGRARQVVAEAAPEAGYVVLVHDPTPEKYRSLLATCTAVLPASCPEQDVVVAVAGAWRALTCLPLSAARMLSGGSGSGAPVALGARDVLWLRALADGVTVGSLARSAGYSQREMYRLLAALYARLGADTRTEALLRADRAGLLATDSPVRPHRGTERPQGARP